MVGPTRAPGRRVYHRDWRTAYVANSARGSALARAAGRHWIDNDWHLTHGGQDWAGLHGAPEQFWFGAGDRCEKQASAVVFAKRRTAGGVEYHIRTLAEALADNQRQDLGTEIEVKDVRPWASVEILDARMAEVAAVAAAVYGPTWRRYVVVKVLTNLGGGIPYALDVCRAAHHHDIPTMLLARGPARFMRFLNHPAVTWVRGSAVIR